MLLLIMPAKTAKEDAILVESPNKFKLIKNPKGDILKRSGKRFYRLSFRSTTDQIFYFFLNDQKETLKYLNNAIAESMIFSLNAKPYCILTPNTKVIFNLC